jgi:threonylcarbamoyladenosine tRNA methylthiotransferase CDKAL1
MTGRKIYMETYGCALAHFDSALMTVVLKSRGHEIVDKPEESDIIIINTCAVRLDTEQKIIKRIKELKRRFPHKKYIITGCLVKARPGLIARNFPDASLISPQNVDKVWIAVENDRKVILLHGERNMKFLPTPPPKDRTATIMIQEGCLGNCSFCITKIARRELRSYPIELIVRAVSNLVKRGVVEIRLTGQDTAAYGIDLYGKPSLPQLLEEILSKVKDNYKIRIGMMTPELALEIIDELLDICADHRVYKFLHIPVQSGDDRVLKLMNRKYTVSDYKYLVKKIRGKFPDSFLATDIIVGHPGEDETAFNNTIKLIKELKIERVHIAQYTLRPRTLSAALDQVPDPVKKKRSTLLSKVVEEIGRERMARYLGKEVEALITERAFRKGSLVGRLDNYIPVIIPENDKLLGKLVKVKITSFSFYDLRGVPLI